MKSPIQLFIAIAILLATATVAAQVYKWVDKDGRVQYSDIPPPAGASKPEAKKVETSNAAASTSPAPPPTLQDRSKAFDKRRTDVAEKNKKAAEDQKIADADDENCKAAKMALRDLETGQPVRRANEQGEINFLSDEERQAELARARAAMAASCKA